MVWVVRWLKIQYKWFLILLASAFSPSVPANEGAASATDLAKLIQDFQASYVSNPELMLPYRCDSARFVSLQRARFNIFRFHHSLVPGPNFRLLLTREPVFIARSFEALSGTVSAAVSLPEEMHQDALVLIDELLDYQQKITATVHWAAAFDRLLDRRSQWGLAVSDVYHEAGFPRSTDTCYHKRKLFDVGTYQTGHGTEGWLYSFWLRRYQEGNFRDTQSGWRGSARMTYEVDAGCIADTGYYYEIQANGIQPLQFTKALGYVQYNLSDFSRNRVVSIEFGGKVLVGTKTANPAFVLLVEDELELPVLWQDVDSLRVDKKGIRDIVVHYETESSTLSATLQLPGAHAASIDFARKFQIGKDVYIFAHWDVGEGHSVCTTYYSLFQVGTTLELIAESVYGCDI